MRVEFSKDAAAYNSYHAHVHTGSINDIQCHDSNDHMAWVWLADGDNAL